MNGIHKVYPPVTLRMWLRLLSLLVLAIPILVTVFFEVEPLPTFILWMACILLAAIGPIDFVNKFLHRRKILGRAVEAFGNLIFRIETPMPFVQNFVLDPLVKGIEGSVRLSLSRTTPKRLRKPITEPVFITLKIPGSVFSKRPDGSMVPVRGVCRGNWIEVEATDFTKTFSLVRHELAHYLLELHFPGTAESSQHTMMRKAGIP